MIELTEEQRRSVDEGKAVRVHENGREYVLLRPDVYDRLAEQGYDDDPWEPEEMEVAKASPTRMSRSRKVMVSVTRWRHSSLRLNCQMPEQRSIISAWS